MGLTTGTVVGVNIRLVARRVAPGQDPGHLVVTVLLGMAGASKAGFVVGGPWSVLVATLGAAGVLHLYGSIARRTV